MLQRLLSMQKSLAKPKIIMVRFLVFFILIAGALMLTSPTLAATTDFAVGTNYGLDQAATFGLSTTPLIVIVGRAIQIFLGLLGIIAVLLIMYGGFIWMTAAGDPAKVEKAKKILINAIIGIIIILSAFTLVSFLLGWFKPGNGGNGNIIPGGANDPYRSGIGKGPIESVYPFPNQRDVAINTWIAVTFKEDINPNSIKDCASGSCILKNVEICEIDFSSNKCIATTTAQFTTSTLASTTVANNDNKTFVFTPNKYLGMEDLKVRRFKVKLLSGIQRASSTESIFKGGYYEWAFETNGQLDLNPPQIVKAGVYPDPDGLADDYVPQTSLAAGSSTISLTLASVSVYNPVKINGQAFTGDPMSIQIAPYPGVTIPGGLQVTAKTTAGFSVSSTAATTSLDFTISNDGTKACFNSEATVLGASFVSQNPGNCVALNSGRNLIDTKVGLSFESNGKMTPGLRWQFEVAKQNNGSAIILKNGINVVARYLLTENDPDIKSEITRKVPNGSGGFNNVKYYTIKIDRASSTITDNNLQNVINASTAGSLVTATIAGAGDIKLITQLTGENQLSLDKENDASNYITFSGTSLSGVSNHFGRTTNDRPDAYNNSKFQIEFNEAINPIFVSNIVVRSGGSVVPASTTVSNQYRTISIRGPYECGKNACGDTMYCWMNNSAGVNTSTAFSVDVSAATLKYCVGGNELVAGNEWCKNWGGTCGSNNRCVKGGLFFPQATSSPDGIIDMAGNSFNGSFNTSTDSKGRVVGVAEGKNGTSAGQSGTTTPYNLNSSDPLYSPSDNTGDNFHWSFYVSTEIDTASPLVKFIQPIGDQSFGEADDENFGDPVRVGFDRIMSSDTLKPGWGYDSTTTSKSWFTRYLILKTITSGANPVGYWVGNNGLDSNGDSYADYTLAKVFHNNYDQSVRYGPLAGSGIQSITQNCFLPGSGPVDAASSTNNCHYNLGATTTSGCVSDASQGSAQVKLNNPASYAKLYCDTGEIDGAGSCSGTCKPLYPTSATSTEAGSWIITKDHTTADANGKTGCCFGRCQ